MVKDDSGIIRPPGSGFVKASASPSSPSVIQADPSAASRPAPVSPSRSQESLLTLLYLLGLGALVAATVFVGDGSSDRPLFAFGVGAVALGAVAGVAVLAGVVPRPSVGRAGVACLALLGALVLWSAISILWSVAPDRSWAATNRALFYLLVLALGIVAGTVVRRAATLWAAALALVIATVVLWGLAGKVFPSLNEDGSRFARLALPLGYWNALALLFVIGLPLALWIATERERRNGVRAVGALLLYGLVVGILLTYSRGGILAGILVLALWLVLSSARLESAAALLLALAGGIPVFLYGLGLPGVADDAQSGSVRASDGRAFGVAVLIGAILVFGIAYALARLEERRPLTDAARATVARGSRFALLVALAAAAVVVGFRGAAAADWIERQADEFANPPTDLLTQGSERLTSVSSNNRWVWWNEAWEAFEAAPLEGTGAGSFATVHQLLREDSLTVTDPHNAVLQFLADTGIVGVLLACGAALAALAGARAALRRLPQHERGAGLAIAIGLLAYVVHSLVDFHWSFVAVTTPALVGAGVLFACCRQRPVARASYVWGAGIPLVAAAVVISFGAPWLAVSKVDDSYAALGEGRADAALAAARTARGLNPLALDPLLARSAAEAALGDVVGARATLIDAVELQPLDADAWYELGVFELGVAGRPQDAVRYLERAAELDPFGPAAELAGEARAGP